jgi:hypothetical protein
MGWTLAGLRGRLDPACAHVPKNVIDAPTLALDAANERNTVERQVEATKVLSTLETHNHQDQDGHPEPEREVGPGLE